MRSLRMLRILKFIFVCLFVCNGNIEWNCLKPFFEWCAVIEYFTHSRLSERPQTNWGNFSSNIVFLMKKLFDIFLLTCFRKQKKILCLWSENFLVCWILQMNYLCISFFLEGTKILKFLFLFGSLKLYVSCSQSQKSSAKRKNDLW
jgi:hypothetical protein